MMSPTTRAEKWAARTGYDTSVSGQLSQRGRRREEKTHNRHPPITILCPEILNCVKTDQSSNKETHKLDTANTSNAYTGHEEPEEPLRLEAVASLVVEFGPAKSGSKGATEQHGVEKNKTADCGVGVFAENHQSNEPDSRPSELEFLGGKVGHGDTGNAKGGIKGSHKSVVDIFGVFLARLEFEGSVVAGEDSGETNQHLSEGRVDVEVVFMLDVVAAKLAKAVGTHNQQTRSNSSVRETRILVHTEPHPRSRYR